MSLQSFIIPVINEPQQFEITLAGVDYLVTCKFNPASDAGWALDISDIDGNPIVNYIPLVLGVNLLEGLDYLGFNGTLTVVNDGSDLSPPTLENLGTFSNLIFTTDVVDQ